MGLELYNTSPTAREVFQEADDSLGFKLSRLIFRGPDAKLKNTANSQPAIMTVSIACWKAWEEQAGPGSKPPNMLAVFFSLASGPRKISLDSLNPRLSSAS